MKYPTLFAFAAVVLGQVSAVNAQSTPEKPELEKPAPATTPPSATPTVHSPSKAELAFQAADKDANGLVSLAEYNASKADPASGEKQFRKADKNGDGMLSFDEYRQSTRKRRNNLGWTAGIVGAWVAYRLARMKRSKRAVAADSDAS